MQPEQLSEATLHRLPSVVTNGNFVSQDGDDIDYEDVVASSEGDDSLNSAIKEMIQQAENIPHENYCVIYRKFLLKAKNVFRIHLCANPPVKVPATVIAFEGKERFVNV